MHNKLNDNSTNPEKPSTHYYDESGALIITNVIQYFQDSIESTDIYSIRFYITKDQDFILSLVFAKKIGVTTTKLTKEQADLLWSHILQSEEALEILCGNKLAITEASKHGHVERSVTLTKKSRISADVIRQKKAYTFLEEAYSAGVNIFIEGKTYSGRSFLLNTLMDSAKDYDPTILLNIFPEMIFGNDHREITEIRGDSPERLIHQVLRMTPYRVVMDDVSVSEDNMKKVLVAARCGTQFVATGYDHLDSIYNEHPYELRAHVEIIRNNDNKLEFNLVSINQIVHQKVGNSDSTSNRLLFDRNRNVAEPTRTLRRKIETAQRRKKEATQRSLETTTLVETPVSTLVSLTSEEKAELEEHCSALREHFKYQSDSLRERFDEIEKLLAKF